MMTPSNGSRQDVPKILLIITDGQSDDVHETWMQAMLARRQGFTVIAVCIHAPAAFITAPPMMAWVAR